MKPHKHTLFSFLLLLVILFTLGGCLSRIDRTTTNYYVFDYKESTENPELRMKQPLPLSLEVLDAEVNRTYAKSQLVVKENYSRIRFLQFDLWANRLNDAIPNLIVQRLRAYNMFRNVSRSTLDFNAEYLLETKLLSLEKIESDNPKAYLEMEFYVRDWNTREIILSHKATRYKDLPDESMVYLIQSYNEMLMQETDILTAKMRMEFSDDYEAGLMKRSQAQKLEEFVYTEASQSAQITADGELLLVLQSPTKAEIRYDIVGLDDEDQVIFRDDGEFNQEKFLSPGKYLVTLGENQEIEIETEVFPKMRTVVSGKWAELVVKIIDESQTRVRLPYDIWQQNPSEQGFIPYGSDTSLGDDDLGQPDKVWIMHPGNYMVRLDGGPWNELVDFTTVTLNEGDSEVLTMVVDPSGEKNLLLGAGILGQEEIAPDRPIIHYGAVHTNISLVGNNSVDRDDPYNSITLTGQLENNIDAEFPYSLLTTRSMYDLGFTKSTDNDLRISTDDYSLKNVLLFTPWINSEAYKNFSLYGRADLQTHFFDTYSNFSQNKNLILIPVEGDSIILTDKARLKTKSAFFPMRLKEGTGITYRLVLNPKTSVSLRCGYGWQQEINQDSYSFDRTGYSQIPGDSLRYDIYVENPNQYNHGIESTLVLSAINILNFLRINSTFDVLFPMDSSGAGVRFENENRFNIKLYRNISLDLKLNVKYDKSQKDWVVYDYGSYLRLSLYY
ncbi:MAG: ABC-type transport auxiliary lipoprotein family protein [Candidatus Syntrophosphaera sp.]